MQASIEEGTATVPFRQRISCSVKDALSASGLGTTKLYELMKSGELESTLVGDRRLIKVRSLLKLLGEEPGA